MPDTINQSVTDVDEIMVTINNRQIPLSEAQTTLDEMSNELRRGYDKKLSDERTETSRLLKEDKDWLNEHNQSLWEYYEPKVDGGRGYIGNPELLKNKPEVKVNTKTDNVEINPEVVLLKKELNDLKSTISKVQNQTFESGKDRVTTTKEELLKKYSYADNKAVKDALENYFLLQNEHPPTIYIEEVIKQSDAHVRKIVEITKKAFKLETTTGKTETTTPPAGGSKPVIEPEKIPDLESESFTKRIFDRLTGG